MIRMNKINHKIKIMKKKKSPINYCHWNINLEIKKLSLKIRYNRYQRKLNN